MLNRRFISCRSVKNRYTEMSNGKFDTVVGNDPITKIPIPLRVVAVPAPAPAPVRGVVVVFAALVVD